MTRQWIRLFVLCVLLLTCGLAAGQCAPCTIWAPTVVPTVADSGDSASIEVGVKFRADSDGYVTGVRFYKSVANGGTHIGNLWDSSGSLLATVQFTGESGSGWQQVSFGTPVLISGGTTYIVSYFTPVGHYAFDSNFFGTSGVDNPPLHALASGVDGSNGVFTYGSTSSFPSSSYNSSNYWVDVVFVPKGSTTPPTVAATSPGNAAGGVPITSTLSATFSVVMDPTTINSSTFQLFDSSNNLIPGTVSYVPATASATFQPSASLAYQTTYTAVVRGNVRDFLGNSMGSDFPWTFTTEMGPSSALCPCTIWSPADAPILPDSKDSAAVELGVKFQADLDGFVTGIRFFKSTANSGTHIGNLWTASGTLLGSVTYSGESESGWQQATFASPITVTAGTTYVASYFTSTGHYAFDQGDFAANVDNAPLHALASGGSGGNGVYVYSASSAFPFSSYNASNYWVDVVYLAQNSTTAPVIRSTTPGSGTTGAALGGAISAQFNEPMDPLTITSTNFQLVDSSNNIIAGTVSYASSTAALVFKPTLGLSPQTVYTATVRSAVRDVFGNALGNDYTWSFTSAPPPADSGPGGPILVIASTENPFSRYMGEILLTEGLNEFRVKDVTTVTSDVLSQYDIAILGDFKLSSAQASMLTTWVNNGGSLIAMHPDTQLATLLGVTPTGGTLSDGYLLVNTQQAPGAGIVGQTIQFHGSADLYSLSGATPVATLYSDVATPTTSPAVTLANAGTGQAAAFTYDLARSVVLLRQGNPAWSGQERVNYIDPTNGTLEIRSADLFYGNASFDAEPDWVNLNQVQIPQADEQQRLLANLIQLMNGNRKPLPRFWYLPSGFKAAVIMTGDNHQGTGTQTRFDTYIAESPANCSVADWTCVRATSYIFPANVTITNYPTYIAEGFEIANHSDNDPSCTNWTPESLDAAITDSLGRMTQYFPLAPPSKTNRTHCVLWSDYDSEPTILLNHGIRLDTTYYYWPDPWVQGRPGLYTGSGLPMRFADRNGNTIDIYQATTHFPDETTWNFPADIDTVLDNALGPLGFYSVITANMHTDYAQSDGSDSIVAEAQARGVPVVTSLQMLTWLDGRNNSTFGSVRWTAPTLSFTVNAASGAHNLEVMVPTKSASGTLIGISLAGTPVGYSLQTIKGLQYAAFLTTGGAYQAVYGGTLYSISGTISGPGGSGATVTLSGAAAATTTADGSGNYSFTNLANGSYTVTPSQTGYTFSPTSQNETVSGANVTGVNFSSVAAAYSMSGTISGPGGSGATVTLSGAAAATTTADGSGNYSFTNLANGSYTVTPSKTGYAFSPTSQNVTVSGANVTGVNFSSVAAAYSMSGTISGPGGSGATVTLSGAAAATTTADGSGNYSFTNLANGSYTITPSKTGYTFSPTSQNETVNNANVTGVNFSSTAGTPVVQLAPTSLSFGNQRVGVAGPAQTVTLTNTGTGILTVSGISFGGTMPADFTQTNNCGTSVVPGANCAINVVFTPHANGSRSAKLLVADNAAGSPQSVGLSGTGISPIVKLSTTSINFGIVLDFKTSPAKSVTVRNTGNTTLNISSITIGGTNAGDFRISSNGCGATLAVSATCTVSVVFTPQAAGTRTATLNFADDASNSPQSVSLNGTGTMVKVSPTSLTFASRTVGTTSGARNVSLTNVGPGTLTIFGITITGTNSGDFSQTNNCGATLAMNTGCTIAVRFTPSAIGTRTAMLRVDDSDPTSPQFVSLTGTGQ